MATKTITISGFKGGYSNDAYSSLSKQTFQTAKDLDVFTNERILTPHLALGADLTDKTRNNIKLDSAIKASDGRIYFKGFDNTNGTVLTIWDAGTSLGSSTALAAEVTAFGAGGGFGMVEFLSDLFYYESSTRIQAFDVGGSAIVTNAIAVNNTCPIFVHEGLKKMFYTVANNQIGATTTATISATAVLTFGEDIRPKMMTGMGRFVVIGTDTANRSKTSKIIIWDGSASTIDDLIDIGDYGLQGIVNVNGNIYALCVTNPAGFGKENVVRIYRWGGGKVELVVELDLQTSNSNAVTINPTSIMAYQDSLLFGMNADTADTMNIDNGIWEYNQKTDILTLSRITEDAVDVDITSINILEGFPLVTWYDGTNYRINHVAASGNKSARGVYESNIFHFDPVFKGRVKNIQIRHKELPASTGFTVKVKEIGKYTDDGTPPAAPSFTTALAQTTDNTTRTTVKSINGTPFNWCDAFQIQIAFDTINSLDAPEIIFPITIEVETNEQVLR